MMAIGITDPCGSEAYVLQTQNEIEKTLENQLPCYAIKQPKKNLLAKAHSHPQETKVNTPGIIS